MDTYILSFLLNEIIPKSYIASTHILNPRFSRHYTGLHVWRPFMHKKLILPQYKRCERCKQTKISIQKHNCLPWPWGTFLHCLSLGGSPVPTALPSPRICHPGHTSFHHPSWPHLMWAFWRNCSRGWTARLLSVCGWVPGDCLPRGTSDDTEPQRPFQTMI